MATVSACGIRIVLKLEVSHLPGFDEGSPDGHDPLQLARLMASRGITLV